MTFSIQLLKMGQCDVMGPEVFWMNHWNDWVQLYFWMAVIRGNGKTAIINTGPPDDLTALNERWSGGFGERGKLARQESERPLNALATLGIKPEDVDYVLITPIQIYATANIQSAISTTPRSTAVRCGRSHRVDSDRRACCLRAVTHSCVKGVLALWRVRAQQAEVRRQKAHPSSLTSGNRACESAVDFPSPNPTGSITGFNPDSNTAAIFLRPSAELVPRASYAKSPWVIRGRIGMSGSIIRVGPDAAMQSRQGVLCGGAR